jgi:cell division protein FtsL
MSAVEQVRSVSRSQVAPGSPASPAPARPPLRVVPPKQGGLRARRLRARLLVVTIGLLIATGMFANVGAQVVLTQRQLRLDQLNQTVAQVQTTNRQLALEVATLESPSRIVSEAESRLEMVIPPQVVYLTPGVEAPAIKVQGVPASPPASGVPRTPTPSTVGIFAPAAPG